MTPDVKPPKNAASSGGNISDLAVSDELMLHPIVELVVQSFDFEYVRKGLYLQSLPQIEEQPPGSEIKLIGAEYYSLYMGVNFFSFFTGRSIEQLTTTFFTQELIRDFHLNFTERVSMGISCLDGADLDKFILGLVESTGRSKPDPESPDISSLINKETLASLYLPPEDLTTLFKSNFWIVTLYVLLVNFQHTNVFSEFIPTARGTRG